MRYSWRPDVAKKRVALLAETVILHGLGYEVRLEAVGRHHLGTDLQQLFAFAGGHFAHGGEAVGVVGGGLLQAVLGLHVELHGHLVAVVLMEIVVQWLAVAADAPAYACGVGGREGAVLEDEQPHACGPFVEVCYNARGIGLQVLGQRLDYDGRSHGEGAAFLIIAVRVQRVYAIVAPHLAVYLAEMAGGLAPINQHYLRRAGDVPAAHTDADAPRQLQLLLRLLQQRLTLLEIRRRIIFVPQIRTDENQFVAKLLAECPCFRRQHRVDASDLVTYLPAGLKQQVYLICHARRGAFR